MTDDRPEGADHPAKNGDDGPTDGGNDGVGGVEDVGSESDAITALERLGLPNYEARVFLALQRLGIGTAKEIHKVAGVPRSQVYGAAESLQERGLVEFQRSSPRRYRPVTPETAKARLTARLERERECAFEYIEAIRHEGADDEAREEVWTVRGRGPITDRVLELIDEARERIVFTAASPDLVTDSIRTALVARADDGIEVMIVSAAADVRRQFVDGPCQVAAPRAEMPVEFTGRMLLVDERAVLLSVRVDAGTGLEPGETGIWSADTAIADVLVRTMRTGITAVVGE